jgi:hypothetical protein
MPSVPAAPQPYTGVPTVEPQFVPIGGFQIRATPEAFGERVGEAVSRLGARFEQAGDVLATAAIQRQNLFNQVTADNATNDYLERETKILYGDPAKAGDIGFMGLRGRDAQYGFNPTWSSLVDLRNQIRGQLQNPQQQLQFDHETRRMQSYSLTRMGAHYDQQLQQSAIDVDRATQTNETFNQNGAAIRGDEEAFQASVQRQLQSKIALLDRTGATPEQYQATSHEVFQNAVITKAEALATLDPQKALTFLEQHQDLVFEKNRYDVLHNSLQSKSEDAAAAAAVNRALGRPTAGGLAPPGAPSTPSEANYAKRSGGFMGDPRDPNFERDNITTVKSPSGAEFRVNNKAAPYFQGFINDLEKEGYKIDPQHSGGYNFRNIRGGAELSEHAYGNAIDVNSDVNIYSKEGKLQTNLPQNVRNLAQKWNLSWGGDWHDLKDAMHFEWRGPGPRRQLGERVQTASFENNVGGVKANAPESYGPGGPRNEYATFATPEEGAAAVARSLIRNAGRISGQGQQPTFRAIMTQYAPDASPDYADSVARAAGATDTDEMMPTGDPAKLTAMVQTIAQREKGKPLPPEVAAAGVQIALAGTGAPDQVVGGPAPPAAPGQPIYTRGQATLAALPNYLEARERIVNDPTLNDKTRDKALAQLNTQFHQEAALNNAMDTNAHNMLRDWQDKNEAELYGQAISGQAIDRQQLAWMTKNQYITPAAERAISAELVRQGKGTDNTDVYNNLDRRARAGEDIGADLSAAVESGDLTGRTALSLLRTVDARKQKRADQTETGNFATLRTLAGMDAQEHPLVDLGREANAAQVALWAQAQQEWNERVHLGGEDSTRVLADMKERYQHPVQSVEALPRLRLGTANGAVKIDDLPSIVIRTQDAHDAGQLSDDQFRREQELIKQYYSVLSAQQARQNAAQNVPTPSAATRGRVKQE